MIRINLLPVREARRVARLRAQGVYLGGAVAAGIVISLIISMWMTARIAHERKLVAVREAELKKLEVIQREVRRFQDDQRDIEQKLATIDQIEAQRTGPVRIMDELSMRIPQRVWLTKINASGGVLVLEGSSMDAEIVADFAAALEDSTMLSRVDLKETRLEENDGLKLSAFKMTAQYPYLSAAPERGQTKGVKSTRRGAPKPAAKAGQE